MLIAAMFIVLFAALAGALLWRLAIYALPLWCAGIASWWTCASGAGLVASLFAGLAAAMAILILGHWTLGATRSHLLSTGIGLAFALPAAIAGYHAAHGIAAAFAVGGWAAVILSAFSAAATGAAAWSGVLRNRPQS
jgi:hypothetical protein